MKNTKIKLFVMFLAGILFSAITVFAATINVSTNFSNNAIQYLQKLVLTDNVGQTGIILDGNNPFKVQISGDVFLDGTVLGENFVGDTIQGQTGKFLSYCNYDGNTCATIDDMIGGGGNSFWDTNGQNLYYSQYNVAIGNNSAQEKLHVHGNGKFSQNVIASKFCNEDGTICNTADEMIGGGDKNIPLNSITTNKIADNSINQSKVESGYVDISSAQTIQGQKTFNNDLILSQGTDRSIYVKDYRNTDHAHLKIRAGNVNQHPGTTGGNLYLDGGEGISTNRPGNVIIGMSNFSNVGIGQPYPTSKLDVIGGIKAVSISFGEVLKIYTSNDYGIIESKEALKFNTSGSYTNMTISKSGDVGIGRDNPIQKLDVNGAIKIGRATINTGCDVNNVGTIQYLTITNGSTLVACMRKKVNANYTSDYGWVALTTVTGGVIQVPQLNVDWESIEAGGVH